MVAELNVSERWRLWRQRVDLEEYDRRWEAMAANGASIHGEAELVCSFAPRRVIDAGCGTGRVAIELARRGLTVVGVDNDTDMLDRARSKSDQVSWVLNDLATLRLQGVYDVIVMAGDVLNYVRRGDESLVVSSLSAHLAAGGRLISGGSLAEPVQLTHYDTWCRTAGLVLEHRFASWAGAPYDRPGPYAVSVHLRPPPPGRRGRRI